MALHGLYILEMKRGADTYTHFGSYDECLAVSKLNDANFDCTVRPAHHDDVVSMIAELQDDLAAARLRHDNAPWGMGPQYRMNIDAIEGRIRHFQSLLQDPPTSSGGQAPAEEAPKPQSAGAAMTLAQAKDAVMRPDTDDDTLLDACKVIDRESRDPFFREVAARIIRHFEPRHLEVE